MERDRRGGGGWNAKGVAVARLEGWPMQHLGLNTLEVRTVCGVSS